MAGLDKTGTLSKGEFAVLHVEEFSHAESAPGLDPLKMAAAVEMYLVLFKAIQLRLKRIELSSWREIIEIKNT